MGVLAALAEHDLLRRVDVISTVSGGSIIGAYLQLKIKQLLERRRSDGLAPDRDGYLQLVQELEREFLGAVQCNLRMRTFADHRANARLLRGGGYTTSARLAEVLEELFYRPLHASDRPMNLAELVIEPSPEFAADAHLRVPSLVINAATLNTGALWQFTGTGVGEVLPSYEHLGEPYLGWLRFDDPALGVGQRQALNWITIGQAVAASCCVPGVFNPLSLPGLFRDQKGEPITVRLVDGGVFDNQGVASLMEAGCTHLVVSDASDVLKRQAEPSGRLLEVAMRANDVLMDRVRGKVLARVLELPQPNVVLFHLGEAPPAGAFPSQPERFAELLAGLRTDLDSFTDLEACGLMHYGHALCAAHLQGKPTRLVAGAREGARPREPEPPSAPVPSSTVAWSFRRLQPLLSEPAGRDRLLHHLEVGARPIFKVFYLGKALPWVIVLAPLIVPVIAVGLVIYLLPPLPWWVWAGVAVLLLSALAYTQNAQIIALIDRVPTLRRWRRRLATLMLPFGVPALAGLAGAAATWLHLRIFDRLYLRYGKL